jgi:uncharacterized membrane protein
MVAMFRKNNNYNDEQDYSQEEYDENNVRDPNHLRGRKDKGDFNRYENDDDDDSFYSSPSVKRKKIKYDNDESVYGEDDSFYKKNNVKFKQNDEFYDQNENKYGMNNKNDFEEEKYINKKRIFDNFFSSDSYNAPEYTMAVMKGFLWVVMFIISFVAVVVLFKNTDDGIKNDINNDSLVVSNGENIKKDYMEIKDIRENEYEFIKETDNNQIIDKDESDFTNEKKEKNNYTNNLEDTESANDVLKNENVIVDKNLAIEKELESLDKEDSLKPEFQNQEVDNSKIENKQFQNQEKIKNKKIEKENKNKNKLSVENEISKQIMETSNKKVNETKKTKDTSKLEINSNFKNRVVYLVNIFSANTMDGAKKSWNEVLAKNSNLFKNYKVYFIKNKTSKGEFYRVSIGAKNVDGGYYFDDRISAIKYCDYIKKYKLNCFVVDNELVNLKNK